MLLQYTDKVSRCVSAATCVGLIELADRLCLPRLVTLVEDTVIKQMEANFEKGEDNTEDALRIIQPCQVNVSTFFQKLTKRGKNLGISKIRIKLAVIIQWIIDKKFVLFLKFSNSLSASQCTPVGRLVSGLPLAELQSHLPEVPQSSESPSPGESGLTQSL